MTDSCHEPRTHGGEVSPVGGREHVCFSAMPRSACAADSFGRGQRHQNSPPPASECSRAFSSATCPSWQRRHHGSLQVDRWGSLGWGRSREGTWDGAEGGGGVCDPGDEPPPPMNLNPVHGSSWTNDQSMIRWVPLTGCFLLDIRVHLISSKGGVGSARKGQGWRWSFLEVTGKGILDHGHCVLGGEM